MTPERQSGRLFHPAAREGRSREMQARTRHFKPKSRVQGMGLARLFAMR
jgi:hypothetical protein